MTDLPDYVRSNRVYWDAHAPEWAAAGRRNWASPEQTWGVFAVPESDLRLLPDVSDLDVVELGCGTAYVSAWLARQGARPVGIDNSAEQLATARRLQAVFGVEFPLIHGNAETVPLADASFDLAISEYGACLWADPYKWVPEVARLLRPGGRLIFLTNAAIHMLCVPDEDGLPATDRLVRPYFRAYRYDWEDTGEVEFHLAHGDWVRLLRASGFDVEDLIEVQAPQGSTTNSPYVTAEWARRWPVEEVWKARRRG